MLLDSDVMVDVLHNYPPAVAWLSGLGNTLVALPGFVAMELRSGGMLSRVAGKHVRRDGDDTSYSVTTRTTVWSDEAARPRKSRSRSKFGAMYSSKNFTSSPKPSQVKAEPG